jgi:hypothetical protein
MDPAFRDQIFGALRIFVPWVLGIIAAKGWLPTDQIGDIGKYTIDVLIGLITVGSIVWSWWTHRQVNQISNVANMHNVTEVVTTKQIARVDLKDDPKVVSTKSTPQRMRRKR